MNFKKYFFLPKELDIFFWYVFLVFLLLIFGLRYQIGGDWNNYLDTFNFLNKLEVRGLEKWTGNYNQWRYSSTYKEAIIFRSLVQLSGFINESFYFFNFICSLIFIYSIQKLSLKLKTKWLVIGILIPYMGIIVHMGYIRQSLAISFLIISILNFFENKKKISLVFFILSALTHIIVAPFILMFLRKNFLVYLIIFTALLVTLNLAKFLNYYHYYLGDGVYFQSKGAIFRILTYIPFFIAYYFFRKELHFTENENIFIKVCIIIFITILILAISDRTTIADRIGVQLILFQVFIVAKIYNALPQDSMKKSLVLIMAIYSSSIFLLWLTFSPYKGDWVPYENIMLYT